jgi:hypothetical protein
MAVAGDLHREDYWDRAGLVILIAGFFIGPLSWLVDLQASYSLVKWACNADRRWILIAVPCASLTTVAIGTVLSWMCFARLRARADEAGSHRIDRSYLLALSGLALNLLFGLLILTSLVPRIVLSPCE